MALGVDGWLRIGTKLDNSELESQLDETENELEKRAKEFDKLLERKDKLELQIDGVEKAKAEIRELTEFKLSLVDEDEETKINSLLNQETIALHKQDVKVQNLKNEYMQVVAAMKENLTVQDTLVAKQDELNGKLEKMNDNVKDVDDETSNATSAMDIFKDSIGQSVKQIGKIALSLFSIRTAYSMLTQASSTLRQYNSEYAGNLDYIKFALTMAIAPALEYILNLVYKIMQYVNYIVNKWFGKTLFKSAKDFKSMATSAKSIKNSLQTTPWDEMTILSETGAGGTDVASPSFDFGEDVEIPEWIKWIADHKDDILGFVAILGGMIVGYKILEFVAGLADIGTGLANLKQLDAGWKPVGVALFAAGVVAVTTNVYKLITSWDEMSTKEKIWTGVMAAIGAAAIALGVAIQQGFSIATLGVGSIVAVIVTAIAAIVGFIAKLASEESAIKSVEDATNDLTEAKKNLNRATDDYISAVDRQEEAHKALQDIEKQTKISGEELAKQVQDGTLDYKNMNQAQRDVYRAYLENKDATEDLQEKMESLNQAKHDVIESTYDEQLALDAQNNELWKYKDAVVKAYQEGEISLEDATEAMSKAMVDMSDVSAEVFTKDMPSDIRSGLDPNKYRTTIQRFKNWWSTNVLGWIERAIRVQKGELEYNVSLRGYGGGGGGGGGGFATGGVVYPLASGAILNQPGRGIPVGRAVAGEAGREGILPLTDPQVMEELGATIAKYMSITAVIENKMDGKLLSRRIQNVQNAREFARNT